MDKAERQQIAGQVRDYLTDIVDEIRTDLYKALAESPEKAVEAHYTCLALNKIYSKIQSDINTNMRRIKGGDPHA